MSTLLWRYFTIAISKAIVAGTNNYVLVAGEAKFETTELRDVDDRRDKWDENKPHFDEFVNNRLPVKDGLK